MKAAWLVIFQEGSPAAMGRFRGEMALQLLQ